VWFTTYAVGHSSRRNHDPRLRLLLLRLLLLLLVVLLLLLLLLMRAEEAAEGEAEGETEGETALADDGRPELRAGDVRPLVAPDDARDDLAAGELIGEGDVEDAQEVDRTAAWRM